MRSTFDQRVTRRPWTQWPIARTGYDRSVRTFIGWWDFLVTLVLVLLTGLTPLSGWPIVIWACAWGCLMNHRRRVTEELCEREGHIPYHPFDSLDAVFCARCDQQLPTRRPQYVSAAVASAASEVNAARREKPEPQSKYSDRR